MFVLLVGRSARLPSLSHDLSSPEVEPCLHYATLSVASVREAAVGAISFVRSSLDVSNVQRMFVYAGGHRFRNYKPPHYPV